jgi:hypothetical protein
VTATGWGIDARTGHRLATDAPTGEVRNGYASAARAASHAGGRLRLDSAGDSVTFTVYLPQVQRGELATS